MNVGNLLPCPFCGGSATSKTGKLCGWHYVSCDNLECGAETRFDEDLQTAIALWNRRAAPAVPDNQVLANRETLADLVVREACETDPADPDDPETIKIRTHDLRWAALTAMLAATPKVGD